MKPSRGNHQLGWSRRRNTWLAKGGQRQNLSRTETGLDATGLDASYHFPAPRRGEGEIFLLTSSFIGSLTDVRRVSQRARFPRAPRRCNASNIVTSPCQVSADLRRR